MEIPNYKKLIMITEANNNKFYELIYDGGTTFIAKWGRVEGGNVSNKQYPTSQWNSIYKEKIKKGYKDITEYVSVKKEDPINKTEIELKEITDTIVSRFIKLMKNYTDGLVSKTYSVKAVNVTQKQIDDAQNLINDLNNIDKNNTTTINNKLIELYTIIPRYMSKVQNHLIPNIDLAKRLIQEQDNLDAMASQVALVAVEKQESPSEVKNNTFLDMIGIKMKAINPTPEVDYLVKQIRQSGRKIEAFMEVEKTKEDKIYQNWISQQSNKNSRMLIHGTRCTSVIPILEQGLKIRPSGNFQFSGKVYGEGSYFSEVVSKSLNYTGYDSDKVLLVYEVHTGNPFIYEGWYRGNSFTLNYKNLKQRGYDSTYVKAGNGLLNSEIIAYKEDQYRVKYIFWLK